MNGLTNEELKGKELLPSLYCAREVIRSEELIEVRITKYENDHELILKEKKEIEERTGALVYITGIFIGIIGLAVMSILGAIIGLVVGIIIGVIIDGILFGKKRKVKADTYFNSKNEVLQQQKITIANQADELCNSQRYTQAHQLIPPDYCDSESIDYIIKLIENRRAETLKEAFNMYEDYLHKKRLEDMQYNQMVATQESALAQKEMAKNSKEVAKAVQNQAYQLEELSRNANKIAKNTKATARATKLNTFVNIVKK